MISTQCSTYSDGSLTDNNLSDGFTSDGSGGVGSNSNTNVFVRVGGPGLGSSSVGSSTASDPGVCSFEGPEKTIEVVFRPNIGAEGGLRNLSRNQLDELCRLAKCEIMSHARNDYADSYVLSESSLFVWEYKYIMKTCGTTTLLFCLSKLFEFAKDIGMEPAWVGFFRKNLMYPEAQVWPHTGFVDEVNYLNGVVIKHDKHDPSSGKGFLIGPITHDHLVVYSTDASQIPPVLPGLATARSTFTLMMFDMHPDVARNFFEEVCPTGEAMRKKSGICDLVEGCLINDTSFSPCGYSMNALYKDAYFTVHVTPEEDSSYVSFETNASPTQLGISVDQGYASLVERVTSIFRPSRFLASVVGTEAALRDGPSMPAQSLHLKCRGAYGEALYTRMENSNCVVGNDLSCAMACFRLSSVSLQEDALSADGPEHVEQE